jgi:hypothetical protein
MKMEYRIWEDEDGYWWWVEKSFTDPTGPYDSSLLAIESLTQFIKDGA